MNETIGANTSTAVVTVTNMGLNAISNPMVFATVIVAALFIGIALAAFSFTWFRRFAHYLESLGTSVIYAAKGLAITMSFIVLYWALIELGNTAASIPLIYYVYAMLGYAGLIVVGYVGTRVYTRLETHLKRLSAK